MKEHPATLDVKGLREILYAFANEDCTSYEAIAKIEALFAVSETAPLVAGDLKTQREIHDSYAPSAIGTLSLGGCAPHLWGSDGITGNLGPFGLKVFADPQMPHDTMEFRDAVTGRVLGKIINVGKA